MSNRLAHATSPYLLQHKDNPVDWYEWGPEAFDEANTRDVPVILSVGYATCHWCHVMAHESFEDVDTANFMNEHFVNVKVDREERPDVDAIYMRVLTATTGRGGWPMTIFLTPDQMPIHAGTYFPKVSMGGHPSFTDVMTAVVRAWDTDRDDAVKQAITIADSLKARAPELQTAPTIEDIESAILRMAAGFDRVNGGFGGAPKFPQAPALELLLRAAALIPGTSAGASAKDMLIRQLSAMARGGIYDHLVGGFARYSVDASWYVPHFEKMLYDNAQLARIYLRAWQLTDIELFRQVAIDVLDYLDREMADPRGGLHSGEDADSEGIEGKFAVWTWDELGSVLGDDRDLAAEIYGATPDGNFEGANNLHRFASIEAVSRNTGLAPDELAQARKSIDDRLRTVRAKRVQPGRDDKIVSAWNALAIRAFAEGGAVLGEPRYMERAESIATFLLTDASPDGQLVRSWRIRPGSPAFADDHAALAVGLYVLYQATGNEQWYEAAEQHVEILRSEFVDSSGGFFSTREDAERLISRPRNTQDSPTPSDNALGLEALLLHASYTGDTSAIVEADRLMQSLSHDALHQPTFAGYSLAVWLTHGVGVNEVALVGPDEGRTELERVVWESFLPNVVLASSSSDATVVPLLQGRVGSARSLAYVCRELVCELPVATPKALSDQINL